MANTMSAIAYPEGIITGKVRSGKDPRSGRVRYVGFDNAGHRVGTFDSFAVAKSAVIRQFRLSRCRATPQETEISIIGSQCLTYSWWQHEATVMNYRVDGDWNAPDNWTATLACGEDGDEPTVKTIGHAEIVEAAHAIAYGHMGIRHVSRECVQACKDLLQLPGEADFDADTADQVLQYAMLGEIRYA